MDDIVDCFTKQNENHEQLEAARAIGDLRSVLMPDHVRLQHYLLAEAEYLLACIGRF